MHDRPTDAGGVAGVQRAVPWPFGASSLGFGGLHPFEARWRLELSPLARIAARVPVSPIPWTPYQLPIRIPRLRRELEPLPLYIDPPEEDGHPVEPDEESEGE